jgi:uncharacterized membrane protein YfcA
MINILGLAALGLSAGILSGLMGIGGGLIVIPVLVYCFGFPQGVAQGTTLAVMIPPVGILAALVYFKGGLVDLRAAGFIALGFVIGGLLGAKLAVGIPNEVLTKIFGVVMLAVGFKMVFLK